MKNLQFCGTWSDLLAGLHTLTPEQLNQPIVASCEARVYCDVSLEITQVPEYFLEGEWQGDQSDYDKWTDEEREGMERDEPGRVYLSLGD